MQDQLSSALARLGFGSQAPLTGGDLYLFTVHLGTMLRTGVSLVPALDVLSGSGPLKTRRVADRLLRAVESGQRFSLALSRQSDSFPGSYVRVIQTGEETGRLVDCLERLADTLERQNRTVRQLNLALVYPAFLMVASAALVLAMVYLIFPMVIKVTQDVGVRPPLLTRCLITISHPWVLIAGTFALGLCGFGLARALRIPGVRRAAETWLPPARFFVQLQILRSVRQLALMLESGVDLLRALNLSAQVADASLLVREAYREVIRQTRAGATLTECFARQDVFPGSLPGMLAVSEQTGGTHQMLHRFCDMLEENLNGQVDAFSAVLEPLMLASMGFVVGFILIAAFLPIYQLGGLG